MHSRVGQNNIIDYAAVEISFFWAPQKYGKLKSEFATKTEQKSLKRVSLLYSNLVSLYALLVIINMIICWPKPLILSTIDGFAYSIDSIN